MYFAIRMFSFFSADNVLTVVSPVSLLMVGGLGSVCGPCLRLLLIHAH